MCPGRRLLAARSPRFQGVGGGSGLWGQQAGPTDHPTGWPHPSDFIPVTQGQRGAEHTLVTSFTSDRTGASWEV